MPSDVGTRDVIVADNDYIVRGILRSILEGEGFSVLQVIDGAEAIDFAKRTVVQLVLLDYRMPKLDGIAASAEIRQLPGYADVPIVMLTAFDNEDTRDAAQQAGVTLVFGKPFKPVDLLRAIAQLLGTAPANAPGFSEAPAVIWKRRSEPTPLFGEPVELSEGRRVLNICRR